MSLRQQARAGTVYAPGLNYAPLPLPPSPFKPATVITSLPPTERDGASGLGDGGGGGSGGSFGGPGGGSALTLDYPADQDFANNSMQVRQKPWRPLQRPGAVKMAMRGARDGGYEPPACA